jgi:hypothetical protein
MARITHCTCRERGKALTKPEPNNYCYQLMVRTSFSCNLSTYRMSPSNRQLFKISDISHIRLQTEDPTGTWAKHHNRVSTNRNQRWVADEKDRDKCECLVCVDPKCDEIPRLMSWSTTSSAWDVCALPPYSLHHL